MIAHEADATLRLARKTLLDAGIEGGSDDALLLFIHATGLNRLDILKEPQRRIDDAKFNALQVLLDRRISGTPVGRIIGKRTIFDLDLTLNDATLEPRDDTGTLIEAVLPLVQNVIKQQGSCSLLDIGTGTGLIALSILKHCENAVATGTDISADALDAARINAENNGLAHQFTTLLSDGFGALDGTFDFIVSNPPYIRKDVIKNLAIEVRDHDPLIALDGGIDGLDFYRLLATQARNFLKQGGIMGVEIGFDQKNEVIALFERANWCFINAYKDLSGHDRALLFQWC